MNGGAAGSNSVAVSWHAIALTLDKLSWRRKKKEGTRDHVRVQRGRRGPYLHRRKDHEISLHMYLISQPAINVHRGTFGFN